MYKVKFDKECLGESRLFDHLSNAIDWGKKYCPEGFKVFRKDRYVLEWSPTEGIIYFLAEAGFRDPVPVLD